MDLIIKTLNSRNGDMMKTSFVKNRIDTLNAILSFIDYTGQEQIYIYGVNRFAKFFIEEIGLPVEGLISDNAKPYLGYSTIMIEEMKEKLNKNIRIISVSENYTEAKNKFLTMGLSAVNQIYDGMYFINPEMESFPKLSDLALSCLSYDPNKEGIYVFDKDKEDFSIKVKGCFRDIKNYKGGYIAANEKTGLCVFDEDFVQQKYIPIAQNDLHGIAIDHDNLDYVYVVETVNDRVSIYNLLSGEKEEQIQFSTVEHDNRHINDIMVVGNCIYLSMFSLNASYDLYHKKHKLKTDGTILRINKNKYFVEEIYASDLYGPHSLFKFNDDIMFCDSFNGEVYCNQQVIFKQDGFLRGVYCDGHHLYVGQSKLRHIPLLREGYLSTANYSGLYCVDLSQKAFTFHLLPHLCIYNIVSRNPLPLAHYI